MAEGADLAQDQQKLMQQTLPCGIELATEELADRKAVVLEFRFLAGMAHEPPELLGLARLVMEVLDKGTQTRGGREISDAFDEIGTRRNSWLGREAMVFTCLCLPEFLDQTISLHADFLRHPTFPDDAFQVSVDLTRQELTLLEDDAQSVTDRALDRQAWGPVLGRHQLGQVETLDRVTRQDLLDYWKRHFHGGRMQVSVAGCIEHAAVADALQHHFEGYGAAEWAGREQTSIEFKPARVHLHKELEQQQIAFCLPGVNVVDDWFPTETVMIRVLAGGMSSRVFTEVREKRGLVYWVGAWHEQARGTGMIYFGASSTPDNCEETYRTLLSEVDRLKDDLTEDELDRARAGILVRSEIRGDVTRSRCGELASDLFFRGHLIPRREKLERVQAVGVADIRRYLDEHPRNALSVVTMGPRDIEVAS